MYTDPDGMAPRNMSSKNRELYISEIEKWADYNKKTNKMGLPNSYDCADVAVYLYGKGIELTDTGLSTSNLLHNGNALPYVSAISSTDFFKEQTSNIDFYSDTSFNNPNVEVGTLMVWKGPGYDPKTETGWDGHVATVVGVTRDKNNDVTNIKIIQGHTGGDRTEVVDITSQADLNKYKGTFLGFGEIGAGATLEQPAIEK